MGKIYKYLDIAIYWMLVLTPFSIAIAPAFTSVCMVILIFIFLLKKILKRERVFIKTGLDIPLLFLFLITCISIFNSAYLRDSFKGGVLRLLQYIFIFFIAAEEIKDPKHIRMIIFSMLGGLALASADGIWQVLRGKDFIRHYQPVPVMGLLRATASFKDPNTYGIYLSAIAPLLFGLALHYFKDSKRIAGIFLSLLVLIAIVLPYSRPTLLAVYAALFFLGIVRKSKVLIIFLIIFALVSPFMLPKSVKEFARAVDYNPVRFMCNDDRIAIYQHSLNMLKDHPIIGLGANTYMKNYKKYKNNPEYRNVVTSDYLYAHNNFLHMAAEIGLIGLAIFIWLLYELFSQCRRIFKDLDNHFLKVVSLSLTGCLIAFLVNGLTESSLYSSRVAIIFWFIAGFAIALNKFTDADRQKAC